jgi:hypothetical protein
VLSRNFLFEKDKFCPENMNAKQEVIKSSAFVQKKIHIHDLLFSAKNEELCRFLNLFCHFFHSEGDS